MKRIIVLLLIGALAACTESNVGPDEDILIPSTASGGGDADTPISFEEMLQSHGKYMVIDHGNQHLYFDDGKPSCPSDEELNKYDRINPPPQTNYQIYHGSNGTFYYEKQGVINFMVYDYLVDEELCIRYYDIYQRLCENGLFQTCIEEKEDCYLGEFFIGTTVVDTLCGLCDQIPGGFSDFRPWNALCEAGLLESI